MPKGNLEVVKRIFEGWAVGDFGTGLADLDPDVVFVVRHPFPEAVETAGPDGIRKYMRAFLDNWQSYAIEVGDLQAVGEVVMADAVQRGRARQAESRWSNGSSCCSPSGKERSCGSSPSSTGTRPSKPPGSRDRR